jgi:hypothetical protein
LAVLAVTSREPPYRSRWSSKMNPADRCFRAVSSNPMSWATLRNPPATRNMASRSPATWVRGSSMFRGNIRTPRANCVPSVAVGEYCFHLSDAVTWPTTRPRRSVVVGVFPESRADEMIRPATHWRASSRPAQNSDSVETTGSPMPGTWNASKIMDRSAVGDYRRRSAAVVVVSTD